MELKLNIVRVDIHNGTLIVLRDDRGLSFDVLTDGNKKWYDVIRELFNRDELDGLEIYNEGEREYL